MIHFDEAARSGPTLNVKPIDDLIFVWGFDIPLINGAAFERKKMVLSEVAACLGKNAVTVITNLRATRLRSLDWGSRLHGFALGSVGLLLGKRYKNVLLSASLGYEQLQPWGSHPQVDPLMSSSQTQLIHYGTGFDRFAKMKFIVKSDLVLKHLHVCWRQGSDGNCGRCEKCCRALLTLELLGARERTATFPNDGFLLEHIKLLQFASPVAQQLFQELRGHAVEAGRQDVVEAIDTCLSGAKKRKGAQQSRGWPQRLARKFRGLFG